jgi:hypothetical protein
MKSLLIPTLFGTIHIELSDYEARNDGRFNGQIIDSEISKGESDFSFAQDDAIDAIESLILAHACAGIDVESPAYIEGINTTLEAISNNS